MRRRQVTRWLGVVGATLISTLGCSGGADPDEGNQAAVSQTGMNTVGSADTMAGGGLDLRLESVTASRPGRTDSGRNPFRFGSDEPSQLQRWAGSAAPDPTPVTAAPMAPPPVPRRSPLRFIGIVEAPSAGLIAVLTDGDVVFEGRQGEVLEGRYRILRVSAERVELELLPAGGRQVLALEGL